MFKRFSPTETISNKSQAKTSVARGIRAQIVEQYPTLAVPFETLWPPKKCLVELLKCRNGTTLVAVEGRVLFFQACIVSHSFIDLTPLTPGQVRDGPWIPHLKLLFEFPDMMATVTADKGAIRHVLGGSDIMDVGLTSAGGRLPPDEQSLDAGAPVCVMAEGKQLAMAVGTLLKSTKDIRRINEGKGVTTLHYIGDGLYFYDKA